MNEITFAQYLKDNSHATHDSVDELVTSAKPFSNTENYSKFLQLQAVFHKIVDNIYHDSALNTQIPNLAELARYQAVLADLKDIQASEADLGELSLPEPQGAEALGWLYCAEGSNLGAAFLFKEAQQNLGFDAEHGARHLAPHADGRGKHWREFVSYLNELPLSQLEREDALKGALNAFAFYKVLVRKIFLVE